MTESLQNVQAVFPSESISVQVKRSYLPEYLEIKTWEDVKDFFSELLNREILSKESLEKWLKDKSELDAFLEEDLGWRYIKMSCDTTNEGYRNSFNFFVNEIQPKLAPLIHELDKKLLANSYTAQLNGSSYFIMLRQIKQRIALFREANIPLLAELAEKEQQYGAIAGSITVEINGQELTIQQASNYLEKEDRTVREEAYRKIAANRLAKKDEFDALFDELLKIRVRIAENAGFDNYRDYMFAALGRFDYTPQDCINFHDAVEKHVVPLVNELDALLKKDLNLEELRPWDTQASKSGMEPLKPFEGADDMMKKTIDCFQKLDPLFGECMQAMKNAGRLDLESRKGKAPGGYNYPLYESGLPFIFMNSTNSLRDLVTIVHEGGHAIQSIVDKPLALVDFKNIPSEVAEVASMSMELMSMENWEIFFANPADLKRAKLKHLKDVIKGLPWIAAVDAFQHHIYLHTNLSADERAEFWLQNIKRFSGTEVNWSGLEAFRKYQWHNQLHIFEVPFYYIEYGFAQLGAISVWMNFRENKEKAIHDYLAALSLGYTASISDIYKTAGIRFDFSGEYVSKLCKAVKEEIKILAN